MLFSLLFQQFLASSNIWMSSRASAWAPTLLFWLTIHIIARVYAQKVESLANLLKSSAQYRLKKQTRVLVETNSSEYWELRKLKMKFTE